jgi:pyruvate/2-oxoglutarate/acetoin dehydrogenase E1 component
MTEGGTMTQVSELLALDAKLTDDDRALLLGECDGWGSWMFTAGEYLCSLGLGTERGGSIAFDTPLAKELIAFLRKRALATKEK